MPHHARMHTLGDRVVTFAKREYVDDKMGGSGGAARQDPPKAAKIRRIAFMAENRHVTRFLNDFGSRAFECQPSSTTRLPAC